MTMHRMKLRVNAALALHFLDPSFERLAFRQHSFASHVVEICGWAMSVCEWHPEADWQYDFTVQPTRRPGRPLTRWDDGLRSFCKRRFPDIPCCTQVAFVQNGNTKPLSLSVNAVAQGCVLHLLPSPPRPHRTVVLVMLFDLGSNGRKRKRKRKRCSADGPSGTGSSTGCDGSHGHGWGRCRGVQLQNRL